MTRNGSAVENARSSDEAGEASPSESRKWRTAFEPRGIGVASVTTYGAGSFLSLRSRALIWKSRAVIQRGSPLIPPAPPAPRATPGNGRTSIDSMRPSVAGSSGSGNTRVIDLIGSATSSFSAGSVFDGGEISVSRVEDELPIVKLKRWSGGQGSAGLNWSVRASTQVQAPGWAGAIF